MLNQLESLPRETESDNLTYGQCKATLLYALIMIQILFNQGKIDNYTDKIEQLKNSHPEDFILARLLLKSLTAVNSLDENSSRYSYKKYKEILQKARQLNQELREKHNYRKAEKHVDLLEASSLGETLKIIDFNRLVNKYIMDNEADASIKVKFRFIIWGRMGYLDGKENKARLLLKIDELLDDGKYKNLKYGQRLYIDFCKIKAEYWSTKMDRAQFDKEIDKYKQVVDNLEVPTLKYEFELRKSNFVS